MKKYQQEFKTSMMLDLAISAQGNDYLRLAQLTYSAIVGIECSFDEWLNSFETPCFIRPEIASDILNYLARETEPTVAPIENEDSEKSSKKKNF